MEKIKPFRATTYDSTSRERERIDIDFYSLEDFQKWLKTIKENPNENPSLFMDELKHLESNAKAHFASNV